MVKLRTLILSVALTLAVSAFVSYKLLVKQRTRGREKMLSISEGAAVFGCLSGTLEITSRLDDWRLIYKFNTDAETGCDIVGANFRKFMERGKNEIGFNDLDIF
jgi:hypothetical protein